MVALAVKNITKMAKKEKLFFALIVITQILMSFSVYFCTGVIYDNSYSLGEDDIHQRSITIEFWGDSGGYDRPELWHTLLKNIFGDNISSETLSSMISTEDEYGDYSFLSVACMLNPLTGEPDMFINEELAYQLVSGRALTRADYEGDAPAAVVTNNISADTLSFSGITFDIVGRRDIGGELQIILSTPQVMKKLKVNMIRLSFNHLISLKQYNQIIEYLNSFYYDEYSITEYYGGDSDAASLLITIALSVGIIMLVCIITLYELYGYLYAKSEKRTVICGIVGASRMKMVSLSVIEAALISTPSLLIGVALFLLVKNSILNDIYYYMDFLFEPYVYFGIFVIIIVFALGQNVLLSMIRFRKSLKSMIQKCG